MEHLREFYANLSDRKKIVLWVSVFFVLFSVIRITVWQTTKGGVPGPKYFAKKLASDSPEEKKFAIYEVGRLGMKSAVPSLATIIKENSDPEIKRAAAASLGKIDSDRLIALLDETKGNEKHAVMETLIKLDRKNMYLLLERFPAEDSETKKTILSFADYLSDPGHSDKILEMAENTSEDVSVRKELLGMMAGRQIDSRMETRLWNLYYHDPEDEIKKLAYTLIKEARKKTAD